MTEDRQPHEIRRWRGGIPSSLANRLWPVMAACLCLGAPPLWAAEKPARAGAGLPGLDGLQPQAGQTVVVENADDAEYDPVGGWIRARGNVVIVSGDQELRADRIDVDVNRNVAWAKGNVTIRKGPGEGNVLRGDSVEYDLTKRTVVIHGMSGQMTPFRLLESTEATGSGGNVFLVRDAKITTCTNAAEHVHYLVRVRELEVVPRKSLTGQGMSWWFGPVPVMYMPYWYRDLEDNLGYNPQPGYSSRMGAFLLNSYSYRLNPWLKGETHLDYRTRRGVALGQDLKWRDKDRQWSGDLTGYYVNDAEPEDDDEAEWKDIDTARYRVRVRHYQALSDRDFLRAGGQYLSDPDILEDFFESEFRRIRQPENFISYTHRGELYQFDALTRSRLNDFYSEVNRLPEASLTFFRRPVGDSRLYYESQSSAGYLEKVWAEHLTNNADYSAARIDSTHMLYYPEKLLGFLNATPRAGLRLTYYSETLSESTSAGTNAPSMSPDGAGVRFRPELGFETSYRAYRTWQGGAVSPLRHVAEPYANYTFAPEPNLTPGELHQFDEIDRLGLDHSVKVGMRNMWQTKRNDTIANLLDTDVYTRLRIERAEGQETLDYLWFDLKFRPLDDWQLNVDGALDFYDEFVNRLNVELVWAPEKTWRISADYLQRQSQTELVSANVRYSPVDAWSYELYQRYELVDSRLEEIGAFVRRNFDCMVWRVGSGFLPGYTRDSGDRHDDEWKFTVEFWLTAFPEFAVRAQ